MARKSAKNRDASGPEESKPDDRERRVRDILRQAYAEVLSEPVPDSFADLLRKLD